MGHRRDEIRLFTNDGGSIFQYPDDGAVGNWQYGLLVSIVGLTTIETSRPAEMAPRNWISMAQVNRALD